MKSTTKHNPKPKQRNTNARGAYKRRRQPYIDIPTDHVAIPLHALKRRHS